jgi:hypothetical protein
MNSISVIVSIVSVFIALSACAITWMGLRLGMLKELMNIYSTPEMASAVKELWIFYRQRCNAEPQKVSEEFKNCRRMSDITFKNIDNARRVVSHFYQLMSVMYQRWTKWPLINRISILDTRLLFQVWHEKDLKIIPNIIIPLEKELASSLGETPNDKDFELLLDLYKASVKHNSKS